MSLTLLLLYILAGFMIYLLFNHNILLTFLKQKRLESDSIGEENDIYNIPGPMRIPFIGTKWIFFWRYSLSKLHEAYQDLNERYGPIVLEVGGGVPIVSLFAKQDIEKVIRCSSKYPYRPPTQIYVEYRKLRPDRYASYGLVQVQGEQWHYLRTNLTQKLTSPRVLQTFLPILNTIFTDFIELIRLKRDSNNIVTNFQELINLLGLEALTTLLLGHRMGFLAENPTENVKQLEKAVLKLFIAIRDSYFGSGLWKYFPSKTWKTFVECEETIYDIISPIVDKALEDELLECCDDDVRSIFNSILQTDLDIRDKKSGIIDLMSAGIKTLANTISFLFYFLSSRPEAQLKIAQEVQQNCYGNTEITQEFLSNAVYTKACVQESFRLSPTAFILARILEEDTNLSGYKLKSGTVVLCQTMLACNNEVNFVNATNFMPERWLNQTDNGAEKNSRHTTQEVPNSPNIVVPFGAGKRFCPGKRFVEMELTALAAVLLKEFQVEYCSDLDRQFEFILGPKLPVNIRFTDRKMSDL